MNIKEAKKRMGKSKWYKQGAAGKVFYFSFPWYTCNDMRICSKKIKSKYDLIFYINNHLFDIYISQKSLKKTAMEYFSRQVKNENFIKNLYANWHSQYVGLYLSETKKILNADLSKLEDKELVFLFDNFSKIYMDIWREVIFLDGFDFYGTKILENITKDIEIDTNDLETLVSPPKPSILQEERISLLNIATYIKNKKIESEIVKAKNILRVGKKHPQVCKRIINHSKRYYWLHNDYSSVEFLSSDYFLKDIKALLKNKKAYDKEKEMTAHLKNLMGQKRKISKKYNFSKKTTNLLEFMSILGNLRDERKSYNQMSGNILQKFIMEMGRRNKLDYKYLEDLFFWEIQDNFGVDKNRIKRLSKIRKQALFYVTSTVEHIDFFGKESLVLSKFLDDGINNGSELKGMPAYAGIVRGKVKIIKDKKDFHKMKKGDVLVAPNTRPEYLPVMKKACAIITEEGGITCHAAIVSRELKIPAIVGVQGAIAVLKNDNLIEVDAKEGKIEILKK